jgi:predicted nucleic acid-binding protein
MVFLDANAVLEVVIAAREHSQRTREFIDNIEDDVAISMLSTHLIMHFGRKEGVDDNILLGMIGSCKILNLESEDFRWATKSERGRDFEDALQVSVALRNGCSEFITLDKKLAKAYAGQDIKIVCL